MRNYYVPVQMQKTWIPCMVWWNTVYKMRSGMFYTALYEGASKGLLSS